MSIFTYSAAKQSGEVLKGERETENEKTLAKTLKTEGLFLLEAKVKGSSLNAITRFSIQGILSRVRGISIVDKMFFTRNLAVMLSAGLSVTRAFEALGEEVVNKKLKAIIEDLSNSVTKGKTLGESLKPHEKVFGQLFINMVEVGEATGKLTLVLKLLANQMKKDYDLRKRVRGAMIYPAIILVALFGIGTVMMIYVVPTLSQTIKDLGVPLPFTTRIVLGVSDLFTKYIFYLFVGIGFLIYGVQRILQSEKGKAAFDRFILYVPIFGPLVKKFNSARFTRILSYLITSGVPIVRSLEITASVLGNTLFRRATLEAVKEIQKGKQLHEILSHYPSIFQPIVIQMISVGEETGKVSTLLLRLALFFEEDVTNTTKNLSTIIEPVLMLIIGIIVGFFAISMLQPIYSSLGNI